MKYSNSMKRAAETVHNRVKALQKENEDIKDIVEGIVQVGTSVPRSFLTSQNNVVIDPSNVGTGILDRMIKTDDTISAAVQFKIMMVLSKIGDYHHDEKEIKEFVQEYLSGMRGPNWGAAMESMLSFHGYKFSVSEIVFGMDGLKKVPRKISTYHPSTIAFEVDENGEITDDGILQFTQQHTQFSNPNWVFSAVRHGFRIKNPFSTPVDRLQPFRVPFFSQIGLVRIPKNKVVHITGQNYSAFGNPYGNSPVRTAHLLWQLKMFIMKQMGVAAKKGAINKIWATAPHGSQKVEVKKPDGTTETLSPAEAVHSMLSDIESTDSFVTGPETDGYKMTVISDATNIDQYVAVINALNVWIFRCFLLPSLVLTDGAAGSRSLGDKHFQLVNQIADIDAEFFGEIVVNQMIERSIIENFGPKKNYGKFNTRPQTSAERTALAQMFGSLANDGWMKPFVKEDMAFVRDNLNLPEDADKSFDITGEIPGEKGELGDDGKLPEPDPGDEGGKEGSNA